MRRTLAQSLTITLLAALATAPVAAQQPAAGPAARPAPRVTEEKKGLLARAKVTPEEAMASAVASVPGSHVKKGEIEEEGGKLIYSFDLQVTGQRREKEVHIDALTGAVLTPDVEPARTTRASAPAKAPAATKAPAAAPAATKKP